MSGHERDLGRLASVPGAPARIPPRSGRSRPLLEVVASGNGSLGSCGDAGRDSGASYRELELDARCSLGGLLWPHWTGHRCRTSRVHKRPAHRRGGGRDGRACPLPQRAKISTQGNPAASPCGLRASLGQCGDASAATSGRATHDARPPQKLPDPHLRLHQVDDPYARTTAPPSPLATASRTLSSTPRRRRPTRDGRRERPWTDEAMLSTAATLFGSLACVH